MKDVSTWRRRHGWLCWPGVCLTIVVYSLNMFGDAVRDLLDPRLRGGVGRLGAYSGKSIKKTTKSIKKTTK